METTVTTTTDASTSLKDKYYILQYVYDIAKEELSGRYAKYIDSKYGGDISINSLVINLENRRICVGPINSENNTNEYRIPLISLATRNNRYNRTSMLTKLEHIVLIAWNEYQEN